MKYEYKYINFCTIDSVLYATPVSKLIITILV